MKRGLWRAIGVAAAVAVLGGCSIAEYTTTHAEADLVKVGWSKAEAACFVNGLSKYYSDQYVEINRHQAAIRHVPFTGVSPQGTDLYVRNELTNAGDLSNAETAEVDRLVQQCRGSQT
ncbi:MAG TPA: hypothetical protein VGO03_12030 [Acidimicrobiia bacterium]